MPGENSCCVINMFKSPGFQCQVKTLVEWSTCSNHLVFDARWTLFISLSRFCSFVDAASSSSTSSPSIGSSSTRIGTSNRWCNSSREGVGRFRDLRTRLSFSTRDIHSSRCFTITNKQTIELHSNHIIHMVSQENKGVLQSPKWFKQVKYLTIEMCHHD